jgi:hypothetical protein
MYEARRSMGLIKALAPLPFSFPTSITEKEGF